jgi:hypothetical protein
VPAQMDRDRRLTSAVAAKAAAGRAAKATPVASSSTVAATEAATSTAWGDEECQLQSKRLPLRRDRRRTHAATEASTRRAVEAAAEAATASETTPEATTATKAAPAAKTKASAKASCVGVDRLGLAAQTTPDARRLPSFNGTAALDIDADVLAGDGDVLGILVSGCSEPEQGASPVSERRAVDKGSRPTHPSCRARARKR